MSVDPKVIKSLKGALNALNRERPHPVPTALISALADLAESGRRIKLDLEASKLLGVPLISISDQPNDKWLMDPLTVRQREVCQLVLDGVPNKEIASVLQISVATVKDHVHAILTKLDLPSRTALVAASRSWKN